MAKHISRKPAQRKARAHHAVKPAVKLHSRRMAAPSAPSTGAAEAAFDLDDAPRPRPTAEAVEEGQEEPGIYGVDRGENAG